ncbi:hypothetical protein ACHAW5_005828 [Stephanodiscus triporus]|uniref:Uncharacterized protein n=1 Tax=Stephanodiscus triporus TaxID=2934178 RepID=A0ABD3QN68_9STRA
MKAWHIRPSTRFFTNYNLRAFLDRLPRACGDSSRAMTVIFSTGEIDCREGIGGSLLQGYYRDCRDAVRCTVMEYLTSLSNLAREYRLQVLVMPVAPHEYRSEKNGKLTGRARRRETTHLWNETLRRDLDDGRGVGTLLHSADRVGRRYDGVYLLDYERRLRQRDANSPVGYVLHPRFNADYTHVNSAIAPLVEDAILHCGCNLTLPYYECKIMNLTQLSALNMQVQMTMAHLRFTVSLWQIGSIDNVKFSSVIIRLKGIVQDNTQGLNEDQMTLARAYKSHWAYYVLVRSLVLGERTKGHRERHHVPVWDVAFGLPDDRAVGPTTRTEEEKKEDGDVCSPLDCGDRFRAILRFATSASPSPSRERSEAGGDESANDDEAPSRRSMPRVAPGGLLSLASHPPIFFVGDSHVLSMAWQTLCIDPSKARTVFRTVPFPVTGMKAWHVRPSTRFFTNYNLRACLDRLPRARGDGGRATTVIFSAGEIDCREGIGGSLLQGYYRDCRDAVRRTVMEYLASLSDLAREYGAGAGDASGAPYRSEKNGKSTGRARRRETTHLWNETLRRDLDGRRGVGTSLHSANRVGRGYDGVYLLDYERRLRQRDANSPVGYVLHPRFNADYTHVNSAIAPLVEDAILHCGCDLTLL